jgi:hypothetical protein
MGRIYSANSKCLWVYTLLCGARQHDKFSNCSSYYITKYGVIKSHCDVASERVRESRKSVKRQAMFFPRADHPPETAIFQIGIGTLIPPLPDRLSSDLISFIHR